MISGTNVKLKSNVLEKVSKHCSTRQARNHWRNCHIRIVSPVEFFWEVRAWISAVERESQDLRDSPSPNSGGISAEFFLANAIECSKFLNRLNLVEKVYKPFEPSSTTKGNGNGYNRV
jgi:hypothetical protein